MNGPNMPFGMPVDRPVDGPSNSEPMQVRAPAGPDSGGNVHPVVVQLPASQAPERGGAERRLEGMRGRGPGRAGLIRIDSQLSDRDRRVLELVGEHRFLTTSQLKQMAFTGHASDRTAARVARRGLRQLAAHWLIQELPRRIGGLYGGSNAHVWHLTQAGKRLLALAAGDGVYVSAARLRDPSMNFVKHALAIGDVRVSAEEMARTGAFTITDVTVEPSCWRTYINLGGGRETIRPDIAMTTVTSDGRFEDRWFVEVDLGTEHLPTVIAKCRQYEAYRATGAEQVDSGVFPLIVWATNSEVRADKLRAAIRGSRGLDRDLYRVVTIPDVAGLIGGGAI